MTRLSIGLFCFLAFLLTLTPPGSCSCWMLPVGAPFHPHFSHAHAKSEHTHEYLFQLFPTTHPDFVPLALTPIQVWIALAVHGSVWWRIFGGLASEEGWLPATPLPPPKGEGIRFQ